MRGRPRNKGPNPLTRSYESNGPDVKVRGTAQHVADKYAQLARDAQVSGDPVAAENYFQHAEHYYRLIATAQEALRQQYGGGARPFDEDGEDGEEDGFQGYGYPGDRVQGAPPMDEAEYGAPPPQQGYDPRGNGQDRGGHERGGQDRGGQRYDRNSGGQDRGNGQDRGPQDRGGQDRGGQDRNQRFPPRPDRNGERFDRNAARPDNNRPDTNRPDNNRGENNRGDRNDQRRERYPRQDQPRHDQPRHDQPRGDAPRQDASGQNFGGDEAARQDMPRQEMPRTDTPRQDLPRHDAPRRDFQPAREARDDEAPAPGLPAFLTNPVRVPIAFGSEPETGGGPAERAPEEANGFSDAPRPRRRVRARRPENGDEPGPAPELAGEGEPPAE